MEIDVSLIYKVISCLKTLLWNNPNIIYVNSNKKRQNKRLIDEVASTLDCKWVLCESNTKLGHKHYKYHLLKMKHSLYDILRNTANSNKLIYSGFASPMFAAFDGYCLGDARKYTFVDLNSSNSKPYKIEYSKKYMKHNLPDKPNSKIVNVIYSCTTDVDTSSISGYKYIFNEKSGDSVKAKYLQNIYSFTKDVLDLCKDNGVERINMYIAAKQPISFIIGTAIQSYHPNVYIYEFIEGKYTTPLNIQKVRIGD